MPFSDTVHLWIALSVAAAIVILSLAIAAGIVILASKSPALFAEALPAMIDRLFRRG